MVANAENSVLERVITRSTGAIAPEAARVFLGWRFTEEEHRRMDELLEKAKAGVMTEAERVEMEEFITAGEILSLLHLKSKLALKLPLGESGSVP